MKDGLVQRIQRARVYRYGRRTIISLEHYTCREFGPTVRARAEIKGRWVYVVAEHPHDLQGTRWFYSYPVWPEALGEV